MKRFVLGTFVLLAAAVFHAEPMTLAVDATDAPRGILHSRMTMPITPGPHRLLFAKWIPGEHGPTGPIANLVNVQIMAGGKRLDWRRDDVEMFAFHIDVPDGTRGLDVTCDFILPGGGQFSGGRTGTASLAVISWNCAVLFPEGTSADDVMVRPSLRIPSGWKVVTALPIETVSGDTLIFKEASLSTVIDSPVQIGVHQKIVKLAESDGRPHEIDLVSDSDAALELPGDFVRTYDNLVEQAGLLFGGRHYRDYHWLLTLSDGVAHFGLEHHESSDDRIGEDSLLKPAGQHHVAGLLAHEYVHSWNGKYRRPADLLSPDYLKPMQGQLLWVYEGLTQYLGYVLSARMGALTLEQSREEMALIAADLDSETGRSWRPLGDTAVEAQILYDTGNQWWSLRRGVDFYDEAIFVWLDADTIIREKSGGKKSLDDFCRAFYGSLTGPMVKPYTFEDVVAAMTSVQPYDWRSFFHEHLDSVDPHLAMGGVTRAGWKLVFNDKENWVLKDNLTDPKQLNLRASLGITLDDKGEVGDVIAGRPAALAGIAPGFTIVAIDGRSFSSERINAAVKASKDGSKPIDVIAKNGDDFGTYHIDYHGGARYPHLVRAESTRDLLSDILNKRTR